jgi:hypothetical protein
MVTLFSNKGFTLAFHIVTSDMEGVLVGDGDGSMEYVGAIVG